MNPAPTGSRELGWTREDAEALRAALAPWTSKEDGLFGYCELAGFFFALACSPELVEPSEWLPIVLGENLEALGAEEEAQPILDLLMRLRNHIQLQVLEHAPSLPAGIEVRPEPMDNFAPEAALSHWANGFLEGQDWLDETWDAYLETEAGEDAEALEESFEASIAVLGFFSSPGFAEDCLAESERPVTVEEMAPEMLEALPEAMRDLAELGRALEEAARERRTPARSTKVGRNTPCPCGSGRKYKHCCGAASRSA